MARKRTLTNFVQPTGDAGSRTDEDRPEYTRRGASRAMRQSLDEMAENSLRLLEGETVVSLDPRTVDASVVSDRFGDDDEDFALLLEAIKQSTPILVRPHPDDASRYMIVFGHRRARVARELGLHSGAREFHQLGRWVPARSDTPGSFAGGGGILRQGFGQRYSPVIDVLPSERRDMGQ
jgi:plasmid partitioning protein RepB